MTTTVQYNLEARESLSAAMKTAAASLQAMGAAAGTSHKELVAGMNAASRAANALNGELRAEAASVNATANASRAAASVLTAQTRAAAQAASAARQVGDSHSQATGGVSGLWKAVAGGTLIGNLASRALGELAQAAGALGGQMVQGASDTEQFSNAFTRLLGSQPASDAFMKSLRQFALGTPFEFEGAAKGAQQLLNLKVSSDQVIPTLTSLGNAVAAGGGKTDEFNRAMLAYTQVVARGKVSAQEMNQFSQAGIPAWDLLADALGKTRAQVMQLSEDGQISAETFQQAFKQAADTRYAGAMASQMDSLAGALSNVTDLIQSLGSSVLGPSLKAVEGAISDVVTAVQDPAVQATLQDWGDKLGRVTVFAVDLGTQIVTVGGQMLQAIRPVTDLIGGLIGTLPQLGAGAGNPVAPLADSMRDLSTQTKLTIGDTRDYKAEISAARDVLEGMKRADTDRKYALDTQIEGERRKLSVLEAQWAVQDRATSIARLQAKIATDTRLAKDVYSSAGQAAAARLVDERAQLEDAQTAAAREGQKQRLQGNIQSLDDQKRAEDRAADLRVRAQQDVIDGLQQAQTAAKDTATAQTKAATDAKTAQDAYVRTLETTQNQYHNLTTAATEGSKGTQGAIADVQKAIAELKRQLDEVAQALGFPNAEAALKEVRYQFALTGSFIKTHMDSAGASFTHFIEGGNIAALKFRQFLGMDLSKDARAAIAKWDAEEASIAQGNSVADAQYAREKRTIDAQFGKTVQTEAPAKDRVRGPTAIGAPPPPGWNPLTAGWPGTTGSVTIQTPSVTVPTSAPVTVATQAATVAARHQLDDAGPRRAAGGPVLAGQAYTVGERGPETFIPSSNGRILPTGSGGAVQVEVTHLCPTCLQRQVETTIRRQGSALIGRSVFAGVG